MFEKVIADLLPGSCRHLRTGFDINSKMCILLVLCASPCWNCRMCSFPAAGNSSPVCSPLRSEHTSLGGLLHCALGTLELTSACPEFLEGAVKSEYRKKWMSGLGAPCPCEQQQERFRPWHAAGPRESFDLLACRAQGLEWGVPEALWAQPPWDRTNNSFPLQGEEMLLLPLGSRVFSPQEEAAARVPAPTPVFLCLMW